MTTAATTAALGKLDHRERMRLRAAAFAAPRVYPGPVGELLARELMSWEEFGYQLGGHALISRVATHLLSVPTAPASPS